MVKLVLGKCFCTNSPFQGTFVSFVIHLVLYRPHQNQLQTKDDHGQPNKLVEQLIIVGIANKGRRMASIDKPAKHYNGQGYTHNNYVDHPAANIVLT